MCRPTHRVREQQRACRGRSPRLPNVARIATSARLCDLATHEARAPSRSDPRSAAEAMSPAGAGSRRRRALGLRLRGRGVCVEGGRHPDDRRLSRGGGADLDDGPLSPPRIAAPVAPEGHRGGDRRRRAPRGARRRIVAALLARAPLLFSSLAAAAPRARSCGSAVRGRRGARRRRG